MKKTFTIVETLITLLSVSIMIAGPVFFAYKSFTYSKFIKSKIECLSFAQEGIELATSLRNGSLNKDEFQNTANICNNGCAIDWNGESSLPTLTTCDGDSCRLLQNSSDTYRSFRHIGDLPSEYYRKVTFTKNTGDSYTVTSKVWKLHEGDELQVDVELKKNIFIYDIEY
jgi:hypothetical protein